MRRSSQRRQRGVSILEVVIGLAIVLAIGGILFATTSAVTHVNGRSSVAYEARADVENVVDQMIAGQNSAVAIYTTCTGNATYPHGSGESCSNIRFKGVDSSGNIHYWGYDYTSKTQTLVPCLSYSSAMGTCGSAGRSLTGILTFSATPTLASQLSIPLLASYSVADHNYEIGSTSEDSACQGAFSSDNRCRLIAGNRIVIVTIANAYAPRTVHLIQGGAPYTTSVLAAALTPAQVGTIATDTPPLPIWFWSTSAATQYIGADEDNYDVYEQNGSVPSPWWSVTATPGPCANLSWQISNNPSPSTNFAIGPTQVGTCGAAGMTIASQDQNAAVPGSVFIAGPLQPGTLTTGVTGAGFSILSPPSVTLQQNQSYTIAAGKTYDADNPDMVTGSNGQVVAKGGDLDNISASGCQNLAPGQGSSWNVNPDGATPNPQYGYVTETITGSSSKTGSCNLKLTNNVTGEAVQIAVTVASPTPCASGCGTPSPGPSSPAQTWPGAVLYPGVGQQLLDGQGVAVCKANQPRAFLGLQMKSPDGNDTDPYGIGIYTDGNGCMFAPSGDPITQTSNNYLGRSSLVFENGYSSAYSYQNINCGSYLSQNGFWPASGVNPGSAVGFLQQGSQVLTSPCSFALTDSTGTINKNGSNTLAAMVGGNCVQQSGNTYIVVGDSCPSATGFVDQAGGCSVNEQYYYSGVHYFAIGSSKVISVNFNNGTGALLVSRNASGTATVTVHGMNEVWSIMYNRQDPNGLCVMHTQGFIAETLTYK